jgi:outer membrane protein assembly factor BamB
MRLVVLAGFALGTGLALNALADWPAFRGPGDQGHAPVKTAPLHWSASSNVVWETELPGSGWSSPVLSQGQLYLTAAVPRTAGDQAAGGNSLRVFRLTADTGKIIWDVEALAESDKTPGIHSKNGHASPTPLVADDRLYVHFGHEGTACLGLDGKVIWRQTDFRYSPVHGNGGSPIRVADLLVFSADGAEQPKVIALEAATGKLRWQTPRQVEVKRTFSFCTPLLIEVGGQRQIISPGSGAVVAYDPQDGHEIWRVRYGEGYSVVPRPVFAHGLLFIGTGYDRPWIYAVRPDGKGDVTETHVAWKLAKGAPNTPSMLVVGDELYAVSDAGIASCLDARTGTVHWSERLGGDFSSSPVWAAGRLYFQNEAGMGFVLAPGKTFQVLAKNDLGSRTLASYAVDEGTFYIRTASRLLRIGSANR